MAAKPARLTTNRHGIFSLRWIVALRMRDEPGRPREVRISLRTRAYLRARILGHEFNLGLERNNSRSLPFDPNAIAPWSLQAGGVNIELNSAEDQRLFQQAMKDDPDLRTALMEAVRSGLQPAVAIAALVAQLKGAVGDAAGVAQSKFAAMAAEKASCAKRALTSNTASGPEKPRTPHGRLEDPIGCRPAPQTAALVVDVRSATWMAFRTRFL